MHKFLFTGEVPLLQTRDEAGSYCVDSIYKIAVLTDRFNLHSPVSQHGVLPQS